jgi:hypothetical protein
MTPKGATMTPIEMVLTKFRNTRETGNGWSACCPAHDDHRASLSISEGADGTVLLVCHAGCTVRAIVSAVDLKLTDLFPPRNGTVATCSGRPKRSGQTFSSAEDAVAELEHRHGNLSAMWTYHNAQGEPVGLVVRWDLADGKKDIRPIARHDDGWRIGAMPGPRPPYRLPELAGARLVILCEGEKAADRWRALGFVATTSAGGSQAAGKTDWAPLAGKEVWIFPDNDLPGRKYAETVARILATLRPAPMVRIVEVPGLPDGGDIVDWTDAHGDAAEPDGMRAELEALAQAVEPWQPEAADDWRYRPFPVDALPEPIRRYVEQGALALGCDAAYLALPALSVAAGLIGYTRVLRLKRTWHVPSVVWTLVIADSGSLKTPAYCLATDYLFKLQARLDLEYKRALAAYAQAKEEWGALAAAAQEAGDEPRPEPKAPVQQSVFTSDATIEAVAELIDDNPRGLIVSCEELAGWLGTFTRYKGKNGGTDLPRWLSMHSAGGFAYHRKTGDRRRIVVPHAATSVCGAIQPGILARAMNDEFVAAGLMARILPAMPPRPRKKWTELEIDRETERGYQQTLDALFALGFATTADGERTPHVLTLLPEAKVLWQQWYAEWAREQHAAEGELAAALAKLEEAAARFALIHHVVTRVNAGQDDLPPVGLESVAAGITLARWFAVEARRVHSLLSESDEEREIRRLVEWIERQGGSVTIRKVQQGCRWLRDPGAAEAALNRLVDAGQGSWREAPSTARGGRPTWVFELSTSSTVYETPARPDEQAGSVDVDNVVPESNGPAGDKPASLFEGAPPPDHYRERL